MDHAFKVNIRSQRIKNGSLIDSPVENAECYIHIENVFDKNEMIDINALKKLALRVINTDDMYAVARKLSIVHDDFMKIRGHIYSTSNEILMEIALGEFASSYAESFFIHPSILDSATFCGA